MKYCFDKGQFREVSDFFGAGKPSCKTIQGVGGQLKGNLNIEMTFLTSTYDLLFCKSYCYILCCTIINHCYMQLNIYGILFVDCTKDATKSCDSLTNKTNIK